LEGARGIEGSGRMAGGKGGRAAGGRAASAAGRWGHLAWRRPRSVEAAAGEMRAGEQGRFVYSCARVLVAL
jgi:hypothetical protein